MAKNQVERRATTFVTARLDKDGLKRALDRAKKDKAISPPIKDRTDLLNRLTCGFADGKVVLP